MLRRIAVYVDDHAEHDFFWVFARAREGWAVDDTGGCRLQKHTYKEAMGKGLLRLQSLVAKLDIWPRLSDVVKDGPASSQRETLCKQSIGGRGGIARKELRPRVWADKLGSAVYTSAWTAIHKHLMLHQNATMTPLAFRSVLQSEVPAPSRLAHDLQSQRISRPKAPAHLDAKIVHCRYSGC